MSTSETAIATTVYAAFCESVTKYPDRPFIHIPAESCRAYHNGPVDYTYSQAANSIEALRLSYQASGLGVGHRVALLLDNRAPFFLHWFALNSLGVSVVPINTELSSDEMAYQLEHSEACLAVSIPEKLEQLKQALSCGRLSVPAVTLCNMADLPAMDDGAIITAYQHSECALLYTSGSTGKPKGCVLSNEYFLLSGRWYRDLGGLCQLEAGVERLLTPLPLAHMNAMACSTMGMLFTGGCIIQLDRFHPSSWWQSVRDSRATIIHYLGVMPAILLSLDESVDDDFSGQLKFGFGAGVNPKHHQLFERRFGVPLIEAWAMTESGLGGCIAANREPRHVGSSCVGVPPATVEYRLVDEQGNDVAPGENGELLVRGAGDDPFKGFFSGYLKNEQATAKVLDGGWLHTGDVLRQGDDGALYFVDRRKNVIRRSGENISALEVEAALANSTLIDNAVVVAVPDDIRGDEVMAVVVLKPFIGASNEAAMNIFANCSELLSYYKTPGYIAFVETLPLTASGKPRRAELKAQACAYLDSNRCFDLRQYKRRNTTGGT